MKLSELYRIFLFRDLMLEKGAGPSNANLRPVFVKDEREKDRDGYIAYTLPSNGYTAIVYLYDGSVSLGCSMKADITVEDSHISPKHVALYRHGKDYFVTNISKDKPVYLNNEVIEFGVPKRIHDGDQIQLGNTFIMAFHRKYPEIMQCLEIGVSNASNT